MADNRIEVGLAYQDGGVGAGLTIDGSTTDIAHTITLMAAPGNRHLGNGGAGAYLQPIFAPTILVQGPERARGVARRCAAAAAARPRARSAWT